MKNIEFIYRRIIELCKEKGITLSQFATKSRISKSTLYSTKKSKCKTIKLNTLVKICIYFNISIKDFFNSPALGKFEFNN